jgi:transcriptional regulator with XRE-family HTH domain
MTAIRRRRPAPPRRETEASKALVVARKKARLLSRQLAEGLGVTPRTVGRWESGASHPSGEQWQRIARFLADFVPNEAAGLARAAGVASPLPERVPVDTDAIRQALFRAADLLDTSPRRVRAAVREIVKATMAVRGSLADLAQAAEDPTEAP